MIQGSISRRRFFKASMWAAGSLALYSGEISRHWLEVVRRDISLAGLPAVFDGMSIAQLSEIHMDEFTEPFFLRDVVDRVNRMQPDAVLLTGDFVTQGRGKKDFAVGAAWQCTNILSGLSCRKLYAILGNHDVAVGAKQVTEALRANGITVL